jgi:adenosyl cobinamide kinase/adenosyl cobinamide phosphate guanylyltransferase
MNPKSTFAERIQEAAQNAVLSIVTSGGWLQPDYNNRVKIDGPTMQAIYGMIDMEALKLKIKERIEGELADRVVNHLASEMATDIKTILSNKERREALRAVARQHLDANISASNEKTP